MVAVEMTGVVVAAAVVLAGAVRGVLAIDGVESPSVVIREVGVIVDVSVGDFNVTVGGGGVVFKQAALQSFFISKLLPLPPQPP